jgi:hypothetical protein
MPADLLPSSSGSLEIACQCPPRNFQYCNFPFQLRCIRVQKNAAQRENIARQRRGRFLNLIAAGLTVTVPKFRYPLDGAKYSGAPV